MREVSFYSNPYHIYPPYTMGAAYSLAAPVHSKEKKGGIPLDDYEQMASTRLDQPPAPRRSARRWFLMGGLAFAFLLPLGVGAARGFSNGRTPAAALAL